MPSPDIHVAVRVQHVPGQSTPERQLFGYVITLENRGDVTWQLLSRHWDITSGDGQKFTVEGLGVVGEQPILGPGASYTYTSFVTVDALPGRMSGFFTLQDAWGVRAELPIPPFALGRAERVLN